MSSARSRPFLRSLEPVLVVCDLDNTLLGDESKLRDFFKLWKARLAEEAAAGGQNGASKLAYATGRSYETYIPLVEQGTLAPPDVAITYTGADIRVQGDPAAGARWAEHVSEHWDPEAIHGALGRFGFPLLELSAGRVVYGEHQEESAGASESGITREILSAMKDAVSEKGLQAEFIKSTHHDGTFLDVLPLGIDKGSAVAYVQKHFSIPFVRTIIAGDSWNDWAMMRSGGAARILVGNASDELVHQCTKELAAGEVYHAQDTFAGGVIEGCRAYGLFPTEEGNAG